MINIKVAVGGHLTYSDFRALPEGSDGLYLVYRINQEDRRLRLIYVGKSVDVSDRVSENHQHYNDWLAWAGGDVSRLRFSWVELLDHKSELLRCEATLIFALKPPVNKNERDNFGYEDTTVLFTGRQVCCRDCVVAMKSR